MHSWWGEILVGYGVIIFSLYVVMYALLIYRLAVMKYRVEVKATNYRTSFAFLIIYILASMTSANNMFIEWHWVFSASSLVLSSS